MVKARTQIRTVLLVGFAFISGSNEHVGVKAFSASSSKRTTSVDTRNGRGKRNPALSSKDHRYDDISTDNYFSSKAKLPTGELSSERSAFGKQTTTLAASLAFALAAASTTLPIQPANAYISSDYASDTVQTAIRDLNAARGKADETFKVYESIAGIITEGKGVGGQINFKGVELDRGYVADEDTSIYNPGLSLLTESEKERLVEGVIDARKAGVRANRWTEQNQYAYEFLRQKLDPYHMVELRGFLGIVPFYGAAIYVVVLAIQQLFRDAFQIAYLIGVAAFFLPIVGLVLAGP